MASSSTPEEPANLRNPARGNRLKAGVINTQDRVADKRLAIEIGQLQSDLCFVSRSITLCGRQNFYVGDPVLGGHNQFTNLSVNLAVCNGQSFNKNVGHVFPTDWNIDRHAFALHSNQLRRGTQSIHRSNKQQNSPVCIVCAHLKFGGIARLVFALVSDQFEVVESIASTVIIIPADKEDVATFLFVAFPITHFDRHSVLSGLRQRHLLARPASFSSVDFPGCDLFLNRIIAVRIGHRVERCSSFTVDGFPCRRASLHANCCCITRAIMTTISPHEHFVR